jgi:cephalosporin-C deacetylase-like acetyl esterase
MMRGISLAILLLAASFAAADETPSTKAGDEKIDRYLAERTKELSGRFLDGARTREEWQKKLPRLRREYLDMIGLWPLPEKTPLHAQVTGTLTHADVLIEKLHYQSRPGLYVTANLYRPKSPSGKLPAILYVCGHSGRGRDGNKTAYQDHGLWFASNGYVCLIVDTLQLGEIPGIHHGTYREGRWWWQARGYTPAGVECWNGIRGIDYLCSRPDVDRERIGVTGISGGGASTIWIAAADERVKVAVPVSGMSDLESYVSHKIINGHCDCMVMINTYQWEWTTITALIAPRPLLFCNSDNDDIFPMDGNRRIIERLRQLYRTYDRPELVDDHVSKGGHAYRPDLRIAVFRWLNKHLKHDTGPVKDADFKLLPGKELRVFATDRDVPADALNGKIDETFVPRGEPKLPAAEQFGQWKKEVLHQLRAQSFRTFPERIAAAQPVQRVVGNRRWIDITTEPGVEVRTAPSRIIGAGERTSWLVVMSPEDDTSADIAWAKPYVGKDAFMQLWPRGTKGAWPWTHKSPPNYVERAHALLGRTVDSGRVWDVAAVLRGLKDPALDQIEWKIIGRGQAGVIAAYAALFEPSIKEIVLVDPPASHRDGPIFINVLRVLDIPEALGLLAPHISLTLVNAKDKAFDRTVQLYRLAGAEGKFRRK